MIGSRRSLPLRLSHSFAGRVIGDTDQPDPADLTSMKDSTHGWCGQTVPTVRKSQATLADA